MNLIKRLSLYMQVEYWRNVCASLNREIAQRDGEIRILAETSMRASEAISSLEAEKAMQTETIKSLEKTALARELRHRNECDALRAKIADLKSQNRVLMQQRAATGEFV